MSDEVKVPKSTYLTAIIAAAALIISVIGSSFAAYMAVQNNLYTLDGKLATHEARLTAVEHEIEAQHKENLDYQTEMRGQVAHAIDMLTDVRLQVAKFPSHAR